MIMANANRIVVDEVINYRRRRTSYTRPRGEDQQEDQGKERFWDPIQRGQRLEAVVGWPPS